MRLTEPSFDGCPCDDQSLCKPIESWPEQEVFGFGATVDRWEYYPWDIITSVAWAQGGDIVCKAHSKGSRIIAAAPADMPLSANATERAVWT